MRKIGEVLRLDSLGLSQRQIALSCCVGQATVSNYLKAAEQAGLKWPDIAEWGEERLVEALAPAGPMAPRRAQWPEPDYTAIRQQLQTHKHVTLQLLWEEYREQHPDGYRYSRYCELYRRWLRHIKRWRCATSTRPARSCLSTTPVRPSPSEEKTRNGI